MSDPLGGGCRCGALRYKVSGEQIAGVICHCKGCQRRTGASTGVMFVDRHRTSWTGQHRSYIDPKTTQPIRMLFCESCGSTIAALAGSYPDVQIILAASLDNPQAFVPQLHMWVSEKPHWVNISDALPQFQRHPDWEKVGGMPDIGRFIPFDASDMRLTIE